MLCASLLAILWLFLLLFALLLLPALTRALFAGTRLLRAPVRDWMRPLRPALGGRRMTVDRLVAFEIAVRLGV